MTGPDTQPRKPVILRLKEHITAGPEHVPVQVLTGPDKLVPALAELAGPLGLQ